MFKGSFSLKIVFAVTFTLLFMLLVYPAKTYAFQMDTSLSTADASFIGEAANDNSGYFVIAKAGDINCDGLDDILIGAYGNDEGGLDAGQTYLFFGKLPGWNMDTNLSNANASFIGENAGDFSGRVVSGAGDVNNDGCDDFLIGAYNNDENGSNSGQTYLFFGKNTGWTMNTSLSVADVSFLGEAIDDWSGRLNTSVGDVNNDSYDDFLIAAYGNDENGNLAGQTYLILGKKTGWVKDLNLSNADASFWGEAPVDLSGEAISAAGDVNNDNYDDFLIGSYSNDENGLNSGQSYLIMGKPGGWSRDTNLNASSASFLGENANDLSGTFNFGYGDINGDGFSDFLINGFTNDKSGSDAGQTYLFFGKSSGWNMDTNLSQADASFLGEYSDDRSGFSLSGANDFNDDGYDDILISSWRNDDSGTDAGQTYLIYGKKDGWSMFTNLANSDASFLGETANDMSGYGSIGVGDTNGDKADDFIITAYGNDEGGSNAGQTYLFFGEPKPRLFYSGIGFTESAANDGSVIGSIIITLSGDTFQDIDNDNLLDIPSEVIIGNIPNGLIPIITLSDNDTVATLTFTGFAINNSDIDDITDITFNFQDGAFTNTLSASDILSASGPFSTNIGISFIDILPITGMEILFFEILSGMLLFFTVILKTKLL